MEQLKKRILEEGTTRSGKDIIKVDSFLNHQIDPFLMQDMAKEFKRLFKDSNVTKVLTVEASGIAIASFVAAELGVPFVFAKKHNARNLDDNVYTAEVYSFTKMVSYTIKVAKDYLSAGDNVLIIDDFLANGKALEGLISIVKAAGAKVAGCGIAIEKVYQGGGNRIRSLGYRVESLAMIKEITQEGQIIFE